MTSRSEYPGEPVPMSVDTDALAALARVELKTMNTALNASRRFMLRSPLGHQAVGLVILGSFILLPLRSVVSVFVRTRVVRNSAAALGASIRSHVFRLCWLGQRDSTLPTGRSAFAWLADPRVRIIRECGRPPTKASPSESRRQCFQEREHVTLLGNHRTHDTVATCEVARAAFRSSARSPGARTGVDRHPRRAGRSGVPSAQPERSRPTASRRRPRRVASTPAPHTH